MRVKTFLGEMGQYLRDRNAYRAWSLAGQDGIIGTAGILLAFTGAGASQTTLVVAGAAATVAGMLTTGGAKWSETAGEREAQLQAIAEERREYRLHPDIERQDIIRHYEEKGLSAELAIKVADELMARSPLKAALECEHGILKITSRAEAPLSGLASSVAYALGAAIPFAIVYFLPVDIEVRVVLLSVFLSLSLISVLGARAGHLDVMRTIMRSLVVASLTILVSYLVGELAF